jgi:hypothetical protein
VGRGRAYSVTNEAKIHIVRHKEDGGDIFSVRFGDEGFVLEFDEGLMPRRIQALQEKAG